MNELVKQVEFNKSARFIYIFSEALNNRLLQIYSDLLN